MTKELTFVLLVIALFSFVNLAVADMYKWVDQNGVIHFSDTLPSTNNQVEDHGKDQLSGIKPRVCSYKTENTSAANKKR